VYELLKIISLERGNSRAESHVYATKEFSLTLLDQDGSRRADDQQSVDNYHNDISDTICAFNRAVIIDSGILQPSLSTLGGL
jgi:hypothetical protein